MQEEELKSRGDELAEALRKLRPAQPQAVAREVWFDAGYRAGRRSLNVWRATAAMLVVGMTGLVAWEHGARAPITPQMPVAVHQSTEPPTTSADRLMATGDASYARLRDELLREGLQALGSPELPGGNPNPPPELRASRKGDIADEYLNIRG